MSKSEKRYYLAILNWLKAQGYYIGGHWKGRKIKLYKTIGTKHLKVDCCGVRNTGNEYLDDVEVAVVEVKDGKIRARFVQQALGYSVMAHKVYLAGPQKLSETPEIVQRLLERTGVGYLEISRNIEKRQWDVTERVSAMRQTPNRAELLALLATMSICQCTLCRGYFFRWGKVGSKDYHTLMPIRRPKHIDYTRDKDAKAFEKLKSGRSLGEQYTIRRYLCRSCVIDLPKQLEEWRVQHRKEALE